LLWRTASIYILVSRAERSCFYTPKKAVASPKNFPTRRVSAVFRYGMIFFPLYKKMYMEKMQDLKDLFTHELEDLLSAETQIIEALPSMIERAKNQQLKNALQQHLQVTEKQKQRLQEIVDSLEDGQENKEEKTGLLARLFSGGEKVCKGMQGLIKEGEKIIGADMNPQVLDAAIIASAQKIEHYEICAYGTVKAYADELNLPQISKKLEQTLNEEYEADDLLTNLALGGVNQKAENGSVSRSSRKTSDRSTNKSSGKSSSKKNDRPGRTTSAASAKKGSARNRKTRTPGSKKRSTAKSK
jgi:ferritin-like metal-binding protein YciE